MSEKEITIDKADKVEKPTKASWKFKYKSYREILPIIDTEAKRTISGERQNIVVKARNWRIDLDLTDARDKSINDALMKSSQRNVSFWLMDDVKKTDGVSERAGTLTQLLKMSYEELVTMLDGRDMERYKIVPFKSSKEEIMTAIIMSKKLVQ